MDEEKIEREFKDNIFEHSERELIERLKIMRSRSEEATIKTEMNRRLIVAIRDFNENSSKQTKKMILLTYLIIGLTVVLGIFALIQIILLLK